jgi:paraquat-inducible protein A
MFPLLTNRVLNQEESHTILEGVILFFRHGDYFVASVILVASLMIPILKLLAIAYIALSIQFTWQIAAIPRGLLFKSVEWIGRWSMIDVFVVVLLVALIQLGAIATIVPGIGVICFLFSVILAMFSANSIDSRLIWANGHT